MITLNKGNFGYPNGLHNLYQILRIFPHLTHVPVILFFSNEYLKKLFKMMINEHSRQYQKGCYYTLKQSSVFPGPQWWQDSEQNSSLSNSQRKKKPPGRLLITPKASTFINAYTFLCQSMLIECIHPYFLPLWRQTLQRCQQMQLLSAAIRLTRFHVFVYHLRSESLLIPDDFGEARYQVWLVNHSLLFDLSVLF